jgi:hypothetical protein
MRKTICLDALIGSSVNTDKTRRLSPDPGRSASSLAEELSHEKRQPRPLADRVTVAAVVATHVVIRAHRHAGSYGLRLLTQARVHGARKFAALDHGGDLWF